MITLRKDNNDQDISIHDMMMLDTKANMLEAFDHGGLKISKKAPKEVLASSWDHILHDEPAFIIGHLPEEEQKIPQFGIKYRLVVCEDCNTSPLPMPLSMGYIQRIRKSHFCF